MKNYNFLEIFLHDLLLSNKFLKKSLYEIEKIFFLKKKEKKIINEKHVFITGLPRSGTTALLYFLYDTKEFISLTYENMPFIMAPNLFSKIKTKKNYEKKERLHKDEIFYDLKSPEAFDEIFFSTFNREDLKEELENYLNLILIKKTKKRYLSKNNSNYKRIDIITDMLPNSKFLISYREPLQHAFSLFNQHLNFIKIQKNNNFVKRYMNYLGHYEFGTNHKSWNYSKVYNHFDSLNYWIEQWIIFYENIFNKYKNYNNCHFIKYENLQNKEYSQCLLKILQLNQKPNFHLRFKKKEINVAFDKNLYLKASEIYEKLNAVLVT